MHIVTYHSANAKPEKAWVAYIVLLNGNYWGVRFDGPNEQYVIDKARAQWEVERKRVMDSPINDIDGEDEEEVDEKPTGRGSHFVGKAWLIHTVTREKIRVPKEEVDKYLLNGYERGGPRSK